MVLEGTNIAVKRGSAGVEAPRPIRPRLLLIEIARLAVIVFGRDELTPLQRLQVLQLGAQLPVLLVLFEVDVRLANYNVFRPRILTNDVLLQIVACLRLLYRFAAPRPAIIELLCVD